MARMYKRPQCTNGVRQVHLSVPAPVSSVCRSWLGTDWPTDWPVGGVRRVVRTVYGRYGGSVRRVYGWWARLAEVRETSANTWGRGGGAVRGHWTGWCACASPVQPAYANRRPTDEHQKDINLIGCVAWSPVGSVWPVLAHPRPLAEGITKTYASQRPLRHRLRRREGARHLPSWPPTDWRTAGVRSPASASGLGLRPKYTQSEV